MQIELNTQEAAHARAVRDMFSGIARRYDLLNHVLSLNIDKRWRRAVARDLREVLDRPGASVLDVACGTGDLSLELARNAKAGVVGIDFCRPMLTVAHAKSDGMVPFVEGDALGLPFADESFDGVTIAFGLRNLANVAGGLAELYRVLRPAGRVEILEFSSPVVPGFGRLFNFYFSHILPRIGGAVSGSRGAYEYLPDSVAAFPDQKRLAAMIEKAGFGDVKYKDLSGGIAALHSGVKAI